MNDLKLDVRTVGFVGMGSDRVMPLMVTIDTFMQAKSWAREREREREGTTGKNESFFFYTVTLVHLRSFRGERDRPLLWSDAIVLCPALVKSVAVHYKSSQRRSHASAPHQITLQCKQRTHASLAHTHMNQCESLNSHRTHTFEHRCTQAGCVIQRIWIQKEAHQFLDWCIE